MAEPVIQRDFEREQNCCGYDCDFIQPPPEYLQTECPVCLLVLRSPHLASCCGHNFCKECIERVQRDGKGCPLCNCEKFSLTYNRSYDVALKQFQVYCTHRKLGCQWNDKLEMLGKHLNADPKLEGCAFVEVQCYHDGCGQSLQRRLISKHQSRECPQRPFTCEHCHDYESTYYDVMSNHWPVCKCYPVPCPHKCTSCGIERQSLEKHLSEECPLHEVECVFKYAGCETELPRRDMPEHLKDNIGHMSLLARQNQTLARQNQELMAKLLEKEVQIRRMTEENQRQLERKIERLAKDQQENLERTNEQVEELTKGYQKDIYRLQREKDVQIERLTGDYKRAMEETTQKIDVLKAVNLKMEGRCMELQRASKAGFAKIEDRVAKVESGSAASVTKVKRRVLQLENDKATSKKWKDQTLERIAATKAELEKLTQQVVIKTELEDRIGGLEQKQDTAKISRERLHHHVQIAPLQVVMTDARQHRTNKDSWYSEGFYTCPQAYKMCLRVDADGWGNGEGTHVSCSFYLMRGEFDNHLKWPFRGVITIQLLNQREDTNHHSESVTFDEETPEKQTARVTNEERAEDGWGYDTFIPHSEVRYDPATNCQYLMNNCFCFRVKAELF